MMGSMMSGISGLRNHQRAMDVVGNNIANVNTAGFKASRVLFSQVFSDTVANATAPNSETGVGGTDPRQVGMGAAIASIDMLYTEGNTERTDNPMDVSISGKGLFIIKQSTSAPYTFTRAGAFGVDKSGNLKTANGSLVCGWMKRVKSEGAIEEDGFANTMDVEPINIYRDIYNGNKQIIEPQPTTNIVFSGNLNSGTEYEEKVVVPMTLFDNFGNQIQGSMVIEKMENVGISNSVIRADVAAEELKDSNGLPVDWDDAEYVKPITGGYQVVNRKTPGALKVVDSTAEYQFNKWKYDINIDGRPAVDRNGNLIKGTMSFSNNPGEGYGKLERVFDKDGIELADCCLDVVAQYSANPDNIADVHFDFSSMTQYAADDSAYVYDSNGYSTGTLKEYSIGADGVITGIYSNGKQQSLGMIALASFENYTGLKSVGDSSYTATANSGDFRAVPPGDVAGTLLSNTLEMSNVDLSTEFTNMIIFQRGFQANSRGITTADEMLQELVNLKR